jgi:aspartate kinase
VAGFQGVSERLEITSLGRGGSDTTAVALAAALEAEYAEICSDVDGVYSADPRVVPEATLIAALDHGEMQVLADSGAKVLNAEAVEWARRSGIEVVCSATASPAPAAGQRPEGTRIIDQPGLAHARVVAVTAHPGLFVLGPDAPGAPAPADLEATLMALGCAEAEVWRMPGGWGARVPMQNVHGHRALHDAMARLGGVSVREDLTLVTAVGRGLGGPPGVLGPAREALALAGVAIHGQLLDSGRLAFLVDAARAPEAVRALHAALIEGERAV